MRRLEEAVIADPAAPLYMPDRKSTRLNSSHSSISYAVFCLKKKKRRPPAHRELERCVSWDQDARPGHRPSAMGGAIHRRSVTYPPRICFFFFNDPAPTEIYTLSLHDALPISTRSTSVSPGRPAGPGGRAAGRGALPRRDRKSTRLNSSHSSISYAVFCLK